MNIYVDDLSHAIIWLSALCCATISARITLIISRGAMDVFDQKSTWRLLIGALVLPTMITLIAYPFFTHELKSFFAITGIAFALFVAPQVVLPNYIYPLYKFAQPVLSVIAIMMSAILFLGWIN